MENLKSYIKGNFPNNEFIVGPNWIIVKPTKEEIEEFSKIQQYHTAHEKECILCGSKFNFGQGKRVHCICRIFMRCNNYMNSKNKNCNGGIMEYFRDKYSGTKQKLMMDAFTNNKHVNVTCNYACSNETRYEHGTCPNCGAKDVDIYNKRCTYCANKELNQSIECPIHGFQKLSFGGKCIMCHNQTDKMREQARELGKITGSVNIKIAHKSNRKYFEENGIYPSTEAVIKQIENGERESWPGAAKQKFIVKNNIKYYDYNDEYILVDKLIQKLDSGEIDYQTLPGFNQRYNKDGVLSWHYYTEDILTGDINKLSGGNKPNFITKDNIRYYKNELVTDIISKLNSGEYNLSNFPGWNKRCGEWYYKTENILTGDILKLNGSSFLIKDEVKYYYDKSIEDYIPWGDFKKKFQLLNQDIDFFNEIKESYPNAFLQSTFRTQDSKDWSGARGAFEQDLVDKNISYFAYIKFYIDKNGDETEENKVKIKPLVVGKSGSQLVNSGGTDVSFSIDVNDGPARVFLNDTNQFWNKTQIIVIPCTSEGEAYEIEEQICKKYKLFYS